MVIGYDVAVLTKDPPRALTNANLWIAAYLLKKAFIDAVNEREAGQLLQNLTEVGLVGMANAKVLLWAATDSATG